MGANGSTLVYKAKVDKLLMPFTTWSRKDIEALRMRHFHDLGGRCVKVPTPADATRRT